MFEFEACVVLKIKEFADVNDCFQNKRNEEIGHYRQALFNQRMRSADLTNLSSRRIALRAKTEKTNARKGKMR